MRNPKAHEWALRMRDEYILRAHALSLVTQRIHPRDVLAFVLFTPQQRYEVAVREWREFMQGKWPKGNMWRTRTRWLEARPNSQSLQWWALRETLDDYVVDLVKSVPGLGLAKAPFFASLMYPCEPKMPVCLDVHMLRWLNWPGSSGQYEKLTWKRYQEGQRLMREYAEQAKMATFPYQWAVWDYVRTATPMHDGMHVTVTDIAKDLTL